MFRILSLFLTFLLLCSAFTDSALAADGNETLNSATNLGDLGEHTVNDSVGGSEIIPGTGDDADYFRFAPLHSGEARVLFRYQSQFLAPSPTFRILDSSHNTISTEKTVDGSGIGANVVITHTWDVDAATPIYLLVTGSTALGSQSRSYSITIEAPGPPSDDTIAGAVDLGSLGTVTTSGRVGGFSNFVLDGVDYYVFRPSYDGINEVRLSYISDLLIKAAPSATIRNEADEEVTSESDTATVRDINTGDRVTTQTITWRGKSLKPYYIRVTSSVGVSSRSYRYDLTVTGPSADDDFEPNNTRSKAADLGVLVGRNYLPELKLNTSADLDYFKFRSCVSGRASVGVTYDRPLVIFPGTPLDLEMRVLDSQGQEVSTIPNMVVAPLLTGVISVSFPVEARTDYYLEIKLARNSTQVKAYALTIKVPELVLPTISMTVEGGEEHVSYQDPSNVFGLQQSTDLVTWQAVTTSRNGDMETSARSPVEKRFFRAMADCSTGGGVLIPRPDIGGLIVIPHPDLGGVIFPGELVPNPGWRNQVNSVSLP